MSELRKPAVAFIGTRGVPARYGGFETAAEEIGARLVDSGMDVVVYGRNNSGSGVNERYRGMRRVTVPAVRVRSLETLTHTAMALIHWRIAGDSDSTCVVFNVGNAPLLLLGSKKTRSRIIVHLDGVESMRGKWGRLGKAYYRWAERQACKLGVRLIADAAGIREYYFKKHNVAPRVIAYGAPVVDCDAAVLNDYGLEFRNYYVCVARIEPENHIREILQAFATSKLSRPLVLIGGNTYRPRYVARVEADIEMAGDSVIYLGAIWDQGALDSLYAGARAAIHGHSVGGTNPSLLRAMGAGVPVVAHDNVFNREVLGSRGRYFDSVSVLRRQIQELEAMCVEDVHDEGQYHRSRIREYYNWDAVAAQFRELCCETSYENGSRR